MRRTVEQRRGAMDVDDRLALAQQLYERAVFGGDPEAVAAAEPELDGVEADLALARGRILHARFLGDRQPDPSELTVFERAAALYGKLGDARGEGEALFWVGIFHQVVADDSDLARPFFERAYELAVTANDRLTMSYAARHLGFVHQFAGQRDEARERLEESVRLRREVGHRPAEAAGLLALAELAAETGDRERARELLAEATAIAEASEARGTLRWIEAARPEIS